MAESFEELSPERLQELAIELAELCGRLIYVGTMMAQELQDFVDDGVEGGSEMTATKNLIDDWNDIYQQASHLE